jgi:gluconate 2-dehydrogenase gamma chain
MNTDDLSRRMFLINSLTGVSSAWLALRLPEIVAAQEHAHRAAESAAPTKLEYLTAEQAAEIEAMAAQIIPTDDTPGAREARVIYFIDRALTTFDKDKQPEYVKGLKQLQSKQKKMFKHSAKFSDLNPAQQIKVLKSIEKTQFFETVRTHTIMGFLADPSYGGNYDKIGWKLIGFKDDFYFKPPFGYYDREYNEAK